MVLRVAVTMVTEDGLPRGITWAGGDDPAAARSEEGDVSIEGRPCLFHSWSSEDLLTCCSHTGAWGSMAGPEMEL